MSTDSLDFLTGEVSDSTVYKPVDAMQYQAVAADADITDPVAMNWQNRGTTEEERALFSAPFGRVRWKIEADKLGGPTRFVNRIVDQRVVFMPGFNRIGRSNLEALADLIRLKHGLGSKDETVGHRLFESADVDGTDRATRIPILSQRFKEAVLGLRATVRVAHLKGEDGPIDRVVKIVLGKGANYLTG